MTTGNMHLTYISNILVKEIAEKLLPIKLIDFDIEHSTGLDGFMSALYTINIKILDPSDQKTSSQKLIAKFMKGDENFRVSSRCYIQFSNEILIYSEVIPYYSQVLTKAGIESVNAEEWIPKVYAAKFGKIPGLSDSGTTSNESVLVLEHLKEKGYAMGPYLYLDKEHMLKMIKPLAEYHAMTYALRINKDEQLEKLINKIIPLPFVETDETTNNFYDVLYALAFDRFFEYYERCKDSLISTQSVDDIHLEENLRKLKTKFGSNPTSLLEYIRTIRDDSDRKYAVILHGDFNRNNVMFRYEKEDKTPKDCKLIDFQELRYGTPCIDLSFTMFMNMERSIRDEFWMELIKYYHSILFETMSKVANKNDEKKLKELESYTFEDFYKHFSKYALYGVLICMHFLPWLCATKDDLNTLSYEFERDCHGELFRQISLTAGGDDANLKIFEVLKQASKMGYMDII